ncbi:MAG TPA: aspartate carbamoyltransferase [Candidatus Kapabacteria bacterium]|nr:aspartate carbamoyltransferase [Candidatus Kapabacteria bacterium]
MILEHIVESQQFTVPKIMELFERTEQMKRIVKRGGTKDYSNKIMANLFYKPSTRTRFSFESAMYRLGGKVLNTEQAHEFSSEIHGEQLEDTIRIIANYSDVIVLRHLEEGAAKRAAAVSPIPIINAGDGSGGQHPTQALLDLYTIYNECNILDGLSVAFVGALDTGRTVRSLAYLLAKYDRVKLYFVAPSEMQIKQDILDYLDKRNVSYDLVNSTKSIAKKVDIIYQTRIDKEYLQGHNIDISKYNIDTNILKLMKKDARILHPLPRSIEINPEIDNDPRAAYFRQASNGLFVRMALLTILFDEE